MFTPYTPNFQSLMLMLDAAHMGWWKANFQTGELYVSEYIARLLGRVGDKIRIGQLTHLIREDYRMPIHNEFMALKVGSKFDRTFPVELPEGEVWLHAQLVGRQTDPDTGTHLFGYMQRVPVHDRREAEILTLENNYHTVVKENKHMDVLLDHLPIGYFRIRLLYDSDGRAIDYLFLSVNRAAQQIVGIAPDAYTDKTAREAGLPVDAHIDKLAHICIGDYKVCEWFAEKTRRHCRSFLYNTPNDETELVILTLDITDAVTAHKALDEQEKLLRNIIQNAPVGIEIYNLRGRLIDINSCDLEMFGVKDPGKIRGLNLFDNPNFPEETKIRIQHGESADFTARYEFGKLDGYYESTRPGHFDWTGRIRCLYDDRGELTHYLLINIDNTELRQIQNRVSEFEALFRIISEYAQVGYANYNLYNKEGYAQNVWLRNYGEADSAQIGDVIGKYRHIHPEDRKIQLDLLARCSAGEVQSATAICRVLHDDGRKTWIKTHLICRDYRPGEQIIDMLGINYDITALKQTEQELIAAKERAEESNKLKIGLPGQHEPRNPHAAQRDRRLFGTDGYGGRPRPAQRVRRPDPDEQHPVAANHLRRTRPGPDRIGTHRDRPHGIRRPRLLPRGGRDIPPASGRRGRPAAGRRPAPAPARGLQAGAAPDTRQLHAQCREIHDKRFDNDRVLATPGMGAVLRPRYGHRHPRGGARQDFRPVLQGRHLHAGHRARAADLQEHRRTARRPYRRRFRRRRGVVLLGRNPGRGIARAGQIPPRTEWAQFCVLFKSFLYLCKLSEKE